MRQATLDRGRERPHRAPAGMAHSPNYRSRMRSRLRGTRRARSAGRVTQLATTRSRAAGDRDCLTELCARGTVGGALANSRKTPNPASAIPPPGSEPESPATVRPHRHRHTSDNTSRTAHCTTPGHAFAPSGSASTAAGTPTPAIGDTLWHRISRHSSIRRVSAVPASRIMIDAHQPSVYRGMCAPATRLATYRGSVP